MSANTAHPTLIDHLKCFGPQFAVFSFVRFQQHVSNKVEVRKTTSQIWYSYH